MAQNYLFIAISRAKISSVHRPLKDLLQGLMNCFQMRQRCKEVGLESAGKREALKRRLKEHFKNEKLIEAGKLVRYRYAY